MRRKDPNPARKAHFGYSRASEAVNRAFNFILAILVLVPAFPILALIYLLILLVDGPPALYLGTRLGQAKVPFRMYKFRTLAQGTDEKIDSDFVEPRHRLTTGIGQFLRDSRLDELPQLFNVLEGTMDFVGPRPVRPEIYERICRQIQNYDRRFLVKPGILGLSQLVTPYNTPKRLRSLIDNRLLTKKQSMVWELWYVGYTIVQVIKTSVRQIGEVIWRVLIMRVILKRYREKRRLPRVRPEGGRVLFANDGSGEQKALIADLIDINDEAFLIHAAERLPQPFPTEFSVEVGFVWSSRARGVRRAICRGEVYREEKRGSGGYSYVILYEPISPFNYYLFHQYMLKKSIA